MSRGNHNGAAGVGLDSENRAFREFIREKRQRGLLSELEYSTILREFDKVAHAAGDDFEKAKEPLVESLVGHGLANMITKLQEISPAFYDEFIESRGEGWRR